MDTLFNILSTNKTYKQIKRSLASDIDCKVSGLWGASWAYFIGSLVLDMLKERDKWLTFLFITESVADAEESYEDINLFLPNCAILFPILDVFDETEIMKDYSKDASTIERMKVLHKLLINTSSGSLKERYETTKDVKVADLYANLSERINFIVTSIQAVTQSVPSSQLIKKNIIYLEVGKRFRQERLIQWLLERGFDRVPQVESPREFSLKGGIIDVYPQSSDIPFRIEFFGDEIASLREFDIDTQISQREIEKCQILAIRKERHDCAKIGQTAASLVQNTRLSSFDQQASLLSYLPDDTLIILKNIANVEEKVNSIIPESGIGGLTLSYDKIKETLLAFKKIYISTFEPYIGEIATENRYLSHGHRTIISDLQPITTRSQYSFHIKSLERFHQGTEIVIRELKDICATSKKVVIFCNNEAEKRRFNKILGDQGLNIFERLEIKIGHISHGFQFNDIGLTLLSYNEIFRRYEQRRPPRKPVESRPIDSFLDLKKGDLVVHVSHGIARFLGIKRLEAEESQDTFHGPLLVESQDGCFSTCNNLAPTGQKREYLTLEFAEGTVVYVPATHIDIVQKYIGPSEYKPHLSKIGSKAWSKKKEQVQRAINDLAAELIDLQAVRDSIPGIAYREDEEMQKEFEAAFIYQETEDQLRVADEIKSDLESSRPMDRLVCGDVGYGKTELAIRAAFKVVLNGKQVAVLVPTTILAQQHYKTFTERMADYPVRIETLSRFKTKMEQKKTLESVASGLTDIVIGTHRLIQGDVHFKDIGLVIIDEEQRFGVEHKERLKKLRQIVDVLTLTATPIPRTLHMTLLGIRDISSLNTPPVDRKAIQTRIIRFEPGLIRQIVIHELNRNGQVYFVHNRVYNINKMAEIIAGLVPEAKIVVAHGQMNERLLEQRMLLFVEGKADILVSTTIIESGLDIPNVNTILINEADTFGLADLHQLRGRVGRYKHRAYAYFIVPMQRPLTPEAEKKLKAIEEFSDLGAGFKIALRDLEIRGAGNILGNAQHGHIAAVGYEMYCRLLEITTRRLKNQPIPLQINVSINLHLESYLPDDYIYDPGLKMEIYKKLACLQQVEEVKNVEAELKDRFGTPPPPVINLLSETKVKIAAYHSKISSIIRVDGTVIIRTINRKRVELALSPIKEMLRIINEDTIHIKLPDPHISPEKSLKFLMSVLGVQ